MTTRNFRNVKVNDKLFTNNIVTSFLNTANINTSVTQYNSLVFSNTLTQTNCLNIGFNSTIQSGSNLIAIGFTAGQTNQQSGAIAIGIGAGQNSQGTNALAIGVRAGNVSQGINSVAIGFQAGQTLQGANSLAIGTAAGQSFLGTGSIALGNNANATGTGFINNIAIGTSAGTSNPQQNSIAIGTSAGRSNLAFNAIAIGENALVDSLSAAGAIAIGPDTGVNSRGFALSIGGAAGNINLGGIAVGLFAGSNISLTGISIGANASVAQGTGSIKLGGFAGASTFTSANCIVIGRNANASFTNSLYINCSDTSAPLQGAASSIIIRPGPRLSTTGVGLTGTMWFNSNTSEILYQ